MDDHTTLPAADRDYGPEYYSSHCGTVPYVRNDHWLHFFGGIADQIIASFKPATVYDAGCALGFLVESLWDRGIQCWGRDISTFAISETRQDIRGFCDVGSISAAPPGPGTFDMATCIEVVEHMPEAEALAALDTLTRAAPRILFSSSPSDFVEPTHINVRPVLYWLQAFAQRGFSPEWTHNALYLAPHAFVVVRSPQPPGSGELRLFAEWIRTRTALVEREQRIGRMDAEARATAEAWSAAEARLQSDLSADRQRASAERQAAMDAAHRAELERRSIEDNLAAAAHRAVAAEAHAAALAAQQMTVIQAGEQLEASARSAIAEAQMIGRDLQAARHEVAAVHARLLASDEETVTRIALVRAAEARARAAEATLSVIQGSTVWRTTAPLRRAVDGKPALRSVLRLGARAGKWALFWRIPARLGVRAELRSMAAALRTSGGFDPAAYLAANPDVATSRADPALHYVTFGRHEGRPLHPGPALPPPSRPTAVPPSEPVLAAAPAIDAPAPNPPYSAWIEQNRLVPAELDLQRRLVPELTLRPLLSVLTPVYRVDADVLDDTIRSVVAQTYPHWELCLAVGDTNDAARMDVLRAWQARDPRVRVEILAENKGISGNSDATMAMANGEWALLLDHDDMLTPDALFEMVRAINAHPDDDFFYSDKDQVGADGTARMHPLFKGAWSPDTMLNANYLTHFNMFRMDRLRTIGGWDSTTDGAQDWDLFLRLIGDTGRVRHVPKMLYHWRQVATSVAVGGLDTKPWAANGQLRTVDRHLRDAGWAGAKARFDGHNIRIGWPQQWHPSVSLIVLPNGAATTVGMLTHTEVLAAPGAVLEGARIIAGATGSPSDVLDTLIAEATGNILVFWDAGLSGPTQDIIAELTGPLANPAIAAVAGQVLAPDGTIDAFGAFVVDGETRAGYASLRPGEGGPFGNTGWYGNASLMPLRAGAMRRADWTGLSGMMETARPDLLTTLALAGDGRRILLNPFAVAHSLRPGPFDAVPPADDITLHRATGAALPEGDPFVSPHLVFAEHGWMTFRLKQDPVVTSHDYAAEAGYSVAAYDATAAQIDASRAICTAAAGQVPRRVCWVIPPFDVAFYGGIHTILRAAEFMRREHGVQPVFACLGGDASAIVRARMARAFPELAAAAEITRLATADSPIDCGPVDALICTLWTTAFPTLRATQARRKFYFLQDWEPLFYPAGPVSGLVEATYRFGFHAICNTPSLASSYRELGGSADHFMPAVDPAAFHPRQGRRLPGSLFRLFCYARPSAPRNCFETLAEALQILKKRHGDAIDIVTAGAHWSPAAYGLRDVVRHLGLLPYAETGALYRACDAGLVAMTTRHPSYLPFELMASGAAVVTNRNPSTTWLLKDGDNAVLFDLTRSDIVRAVETLMNDQALLNRVTDGGRATIEAGHSDWERTCTDIHAIVARVCEGAAS